MLLLLPLLLLLLPMFHLCRCVGHQHMRDRGKAVVGFGHLNPATPLISCQMLTACLRTQENNKKER